MQNEALLGEMTVIEIKPHRWGWRVFEAPGVEPVFLGKLIFGFPRWIATG
jgi:hypothetical protein